MDDTKIRVRLKFQEGSDILTSQQIEQGLAQSWYLVLLEDVHTIADVAFDIAAAFHLEQSCPNGLSLEVEGFILPASQPACLLKDSDLIRIKRGTGIQGQLSHEARTEHGFTQNKECLGNGLRKVHGHHAVEFLAPDEFEKETGGYESGQEEGEMETDLYLDGKVRPSKGNKCSSDRKKEKNRVGIRKRSGTVASEVGELRKTMDLGVGQELAIVEFKDKANTVVDFGVSQSLGVKRALDAAENAAANVTFGEGKRSRKKLEAGNQSSLSKDEKTEKKRKRNELGTRRQGQVKLIGEERPTSSDVHHSCEHGKDGEEKVKRKKLNPLGAHPVSVTSLETMSQVKVNCVGAKLEDGLKKSVKRSEKNVKRKDVIGLSNEIDVAEGILMKETAVDKVREKKRRKETKLESASGKDRSQERKGSEKSVPARTPDSKVNGESTIARTLKTEANAPIQEQRPSRSARRKKAKRQWLREQAKMALLPVDKTKVLETMGSKVEVVQRELDIRPIHDEVAEVEAEEEVLPIVVRAGHIRFEPYDKGETEDEARPSYATLLLGDQVKTKRQGQKWGQESSTEKQKGKKLPNDADFSESPEDKYRVNKRIGQQIVPVTFEQLPALQGAPQKGDVLAYRLVELTASWTPEISPYRVGVVAHWEPASNMIKVDPHPDYPRLGEKPSVDDEELCKLEEMKEAGPYDENGVLEVEFPSLVEVRLMQRVQSENHEAICSKLDPTTAGAHRANDQTCETVTDIGDNIPTEEQQGVDDGERAGSRSALHALVSEELERKKTELCLRDVVVTNASTDLMAPNEQAEIVEPGNDAGKPFCQPKPVRDRKHKFLKSAGVGSIVALLRAQHAL